MHDLRDANCKGIKNCGQAAKSEGESGRGEGCGKFFERVPFQFHRLGRPPSSSSSSMPTSGHSIIDRSAVISSVCRDRSKRLEHCHSSVGRFSSPPAPPPSICNKRDGHLSSSFARHDSFPAIKSQGKISGETKGVRLLHSFFVICRPPPISSFLYRADDGGPLGTEKRKSSGLRIYVPVQQNTPTARNTIQRSNVSPSPPFLFPSPPPQFRGGERHEPKTAINLSSSFSSLFLWGGF